MRVAGERKTATLKKTCYEAKTQLEKVEMSTVMR